MEPSVKPEMTESLKRKRVAMPVHYTFKVNSFTLLSDALQKSPGAKSYEPPIFEACGHKWKLSLYPNGNTKLGGDKDHISLYLVDIDAVGVEINCMFKFFIMDQLRDEYLTIQDGVVRRFHSLKKEWGFSKLIPLDTLKDETSGYLVDDCCVFGAEILVMTPSKMTSACISMIKVPANGTFTWKVDKFSTIPESNYKSDTFTVEDYQWKLSIGRKATDGGENLSFFLYPHNFSFESKIFADFDLIVKDQLNGKHRQFNVKYWFDNRGFGFHGFMKMTDIKDKSKGFLVEDTLVAEVKINVISKISTA